MHSEAAGLHDAGLALRDDALPKVGRSVDWLVGRSVAGSYAFFGPGLNRHFAAAQSGEPVHVQLPTLEPGFRDLLPQFDICSVPG